MKILLIILAILWIAGWLKQIVSIEVITRQTGIVFPKGTMLPLIIILFFVWPYFYFYEKETMNKL